MDSLYFKGFKRIPWLRPGLRPRISQGLEFREEQADQKRLSPQGSKHAPV